MTTCEYCKNGTEHYCPENEQYDMEQSAYVNWLSSKYDREVERRNRPQDQRTN
jgi:hypothetical protein